MVGVSREEGGSRGGGEGERGSRGVEVQGRGGFREEVGGFSRGGVFSRGGGCWWVCLFLGLVAVFVPRRGEGECFSREERESVFSREERAMPTHIFFGRGPLTGLESGPTRGRSEDSTYQLDCTRDHDTLGHHYPHTLTQECCEPGSRQVLATPQQHRMSLSTSERWALTQEQRHEVKVPKVSHLWLHVSREANHIHAAIESGQDKSTRPPLHDTLDALAALSPSLVRVRTGTHGHSHEHEPTVCSTQVSLEAKASQHSKNCQIASPSGETGRSCFHQKDSQRLNTGEVCIGAAHENKYFMHQTRTVEVTICIVSERLLDRPRQLPKTNEKTLKR